MRIFINIIALTTLLVSGSNLRAADNSNFTRFLLPLVAEDVPGAFRIALDGGDVVLLHRYGRGVH